MPKRSPNSPVYAQVGAKRRKTTTVDALDHLTDNADELIALLQALKKERNGGASSEVSPKLSGRVAQLSQKLLPSFKQLASKDDEPDTQSTDNESPEESKDAAKVVTLPALNLSWDPSRIPSALPTLPKVLDPVVELTAFTHPGWDGTTTSYERLEWLGDAYIEVIATILIYNTFPHLPAGRCSQLREQVVRNITLASFFEDYNLKTKARIPLYIQERNDHHRGRSHAKDLVKIRSDIVEAYAAAVIVSNHETGLAEVIEWLQGLWGRTLRDDIEGAQRKQLLAPPGKVAAIPAGTRAARSAKEELARLIAYKEVRLRYEELPCSEKSKGLNMPIYRIGLYCDGYGESKLLATGEALKKKEAGNIAAALALKMEVTVGLAGKKRAWVEAQAVAKADETV